MTGFFVRLVASYRSAAFTIRGSARERISRNKGVRVRRRKAGGGLRMQESYGEGLASRSGLEGCVGLGNQAKRSPRYSWAVYGTPKASVCGGRPYPDKVKATVMTSDKGEFVVPPTESETTRTVGSSPHAEVDFSARDPGGIRFFHGSGSVGEGPRPQVQHGRRREVRQSSSTGEAGEQGRAACGAGGGTGTDQGER